MNEWKQRGHTNNSMTQFWVTEGSVEVGCSQLEFLVKPVNSDVNNNRAQHFRRGMTVPYVSRGPGKEPKGWHYPTGLLCFPEVPQPGGGCIRSWTQGLCATFHRFSFCSLLYL